VNKRAQVPTILAFVIAIALSGAALFVMASFKGDLELQSQEISELMSEADFLEKYLAEQAKIITKETIDGCFACSDSELEEYLKTIAESHDLEVPGQGNFYGEIRNNNFNFGIGQNQGTTLAVPNLFVISQRGENKITRNFNICLIFDSKGDFVSDCDIKNYPLPTKPKEQTTNIELEDTPRYLESPTYQIKKVDLEGSPNKVERIYLGENADSGIYLDSGKIFADSYIIGETIEVGKYDSNGELSLNKFATQGTPLGERRILEELDGKNYNLIKSGDQSIDFDVQVNNKGELWSGYQDSFGNTEDEIKEFGKERYDKYVEEGAYNCGPNALTEVFTRLGKEDTPSIRKEIHEIRKSGGGFGRGLVSIFTDKAKGITWPGEMKKAVKHFGYGYKKIRGKNKLDQADKILAEREDVEIIVRVDYERRFEQHWTVYNGDNKFYDDKYSDKTARSYKINEVFIVSK